MDRKARNSVLFGPSIHGGTGQARPTGIISPAGHASATSALSSWSTSPAQLGRGPCPASFSPTSRAGVKDDGLFPCEPFSRRHFVGVAGRAGLLAAGLAGAGETDALAASADEGQPIGPQAGLRVLMAGNRRWVLGRARHPRQSVWWRRHLACDQMPFGTVISSIDSRVPPELVFDCGLGEILVVRTAAQTLDPQVVLGSIEFGPTYLASARLIFVLGHQGCSAVQTAIHYISRCERAPGHIQAVVDALRPAYFAAKPRRGNLVENMVRAQIRLTVEQLKQETLLRNQVIVGGR
jgi:carbonic anhydrase